MNLKEFAQQCRQTPIVYRIDKVTYHYNCKGNIIPRKYPIYASGFGGECIGEKEQDANISLHTITSKKELSKKEIINKFLKENPKFKLINNAYKKEYFDVYELGIGNMIIKNFQKGRAKNISQFFEIMRISPFKKCNNK